MHLLFMRGSSVPTSCRNSSMSKSRLYTFLHSEPSSPSLPSNVKANRTRSTSFQRLNEEVATRPFWNRTAVTVFSRSVSAEVLLQVSFACKDIGVFYDISVLKLTRIRAPMQFCQMLRISIFIQFWTKRRSAYCDET